MADKYEPVNLQDWRQTAQRVEYKDYSLQSLDTDWHGIFLPHLHGIGKDDVDLSKGRSLKAKERKFVDELDSRGTFQKTEVRTELKRLSRLELEGRLGVSANKVEDLLDRAERRTADMDRSSNKVQKGEIKYKAFIEVLREYRMTTEQESTIKNAVRVFAFVEEFSCKPPTFVMVFLTLLELLVFTYTSTYLYTSYSVPITWTGPVPYCSSLIYNPSRRWEVWRFASYMLVHIGVGHFVFNMIMQVLVGVSLEMEQSGVLGSFKVMSSQLIKCTEQ